MDHVCTTQQPQQLAGDAVVPYSIVGCCEVDKRRYGLFLSRKPYLMSCVNRVTWSTLDLPCRMPACSCGNNESMFGSTRAWMSVSKILKGTHSRNMGWWLFWSPSGFSGWGIATISALLQIFGILSWCMQQLGKSQSQDLRADLAWSMNSRKMESSVPA